MYNNHKNSLLLQIPTCLPPKILHNDCIRFLLGDEDDPREIENNGYANFFFGGGGVGRGVLWDLRK